MRKRTLTINCRYEPNRLADTYLADAYEQLLKYSVEKTGNEKEVEKSENSKLICKGFIEKAGSGEYNRESNSELERRINSDEHELLDDYKFIDNGYSGSNLERPGLENLRDKVAEGKIDKVYVHSPDRLSRKSAYQMILLEEFKKAGLEVIFLNHKFDDNPDSNLLLQVQGVIAEYERAKIMERNRRGKLHAAGKGCVSVLGNAPYGYQYIKRCEIVGESKFEINEEEAEIVRKIFLWIGKEKVTIREVKRRLGEMCIITQTGKENWHVGTIWHILKNPAYKGQAAFGKTKTDPVLPRLRPKRNACEQSKRNFSTYYTDEKHWIYIPIPSIVDEDLFNTVQERLAENKLRARMQKGKGTFLLQGLVVCRCCKFAYYGTRGGTKEKRYYYYRCTGSDPNRFNGNRMCSSKSICAEILETAIWEKVERLLKRPERIANEYQRRLSENKKPLPDQTLEKQESTLKLSITKFIDSYSKGYISQEEFEPRIKSMKQRLKEIEEQKGKTLDQKKLQQELNIIISSLKHFASSIESKFDQLDWQAKRDIIRKLVKKIVIDPDNIDLVFKIKELTDKGENKKFQHCHRTLNTSN